MNQKLRSHFLAYTGLSAHDHTDASFQGRGVIEGEAFVVSQSRHGNSMIELNFKDCDQRIVDKMLLQDNNDVCAASHI